MILIGYNNHYFHKPTMSLYVLACEEATAMFQLELYIPELKSLKCNL